MTIHNCRICPRSCGADRAGGETGFCGVAGEEIYAARAALHLWEEPCISGESGSGAVFFTGCPLRCVYCQNYHIARAEVGRAISVRRLAEIFLELQAEGAANINLVTPTHYTYSIIEAVNLARDKGLVLPIVYNCGGYEKVETLRDLEGIVDIYLTDFKYLDPRPARDYSRAPDYPEVARAALAEMVRQQPALQYDEKGLLQKGVIVRHLLLPGEVLGAKAVVRYLYRTYGDNIILSLMSQYTPLPQVAEIPALNRKVTEREYRSLTDYAAGLGVSRCYIQEGDPAQESFIPAFDFEGL